MELVPGDIVRVRRNASVQFAGDAAITVRGIRVDPSLTYEGWVWLYGYALDQAGAGNGAPLGFRAVSGARGGGSAGIGSREELATFRLASGDELGDDMISRHEGRVTGRWVRPIGPRSRLHPPRFDSDLSLAVTL